jgi:hypothetical protein
MAQEIIKKINLETLCKNDLYEIHRHIGNLIRRRMFYQLCIQTPERILYYDHTDRFEEVIIELSAFVIDVLQTLGTKEDLDENTFVINRVNGLPLRLRPHVDEPELFNIFHLHLNKYGYAYHVTQFEIQFNHVDL